MLPRRLDSPSLDRFAVRALAGVHREYPNHVLHLLNGDGDALPPRVMHPTFYGCFDWHSAVHTHWLLVRFLRLHPHASSASHVRDALARSLTVAGITGERDYLVSRPGFERPYGLAWLLMLDAELLAAQHGASLDVDAIEWRAALSPLVEVAVEQLCSWLVILSHPIRSGEHSQTMFAIGLAIDWARFVGRDSEATALIDRALAFHGDDCDLPLHLEPSGQDFLSPSLATADLMRRVLDPGPFADWLDQALPQIPDNPSTDWLRVAARADRDDGKLVHLDGLTLSRAWMLAAVRDSLPLDDARRFALDAAYGTHVEHGMRCFDDQGYAGWHWLGSFAVYLLTGGGSGLSSSGLL